MSPEQLTGARRRRSSRGAVFVFGLAACLFLAGIVFGALGLGRAILERGALQDAADASALASAHLAARGMNLLAFLNLLMAALVAVLVGIRLAQTLMTIATATLFALAWPTYGASLPLAALAAEEAETFADLYEEAKDVVFPLLEGLHEGEEAARFLLPKLAFLEAPREASHQRYPTLTAIALPGSSELPVRWDTFSRLCGKAARVGTELALQPLSLVGGQSFLAPVYGAAEEIGKTLSDYLCGQGDDEPPVHLEKEEVAYPRSLAMQECQRDPRSAACLDAELELREAEYDPTTGSCVAPHDCGPAGSYQRLAGLAREQCGPASEAEPLSEWSYQERVSFVRFVATRKGHALIWEETHRKVTSLRLLRAKRPPCGPEGTLAPSFQLALHAARDDEIRPVCKAYIPRHAPGFDPGNAPLPPATRVGQSFEVRETAVLHYLGCSGERERSIPLAEKDDALSGGEEKAPLGMVETVELGDEPFQFRVVASGERTTTHLERALARSLGASEKKPPSWSDAFANARWQVAQSEFFFDHDGTIPREEWLWQPRWTARLRKFRFVEDASEKEKTSPSLGSRGSVCPPDDTKNCERTTSLLGELNDLVAH